MANWRPVSLLNTDYKIITRALAVRLLTVMSSIVEEDQTCGVPGRTIFHTLSFIRDTMDYANEKNLDAYMLTIDQMKAFDRVDRGFMIKVLRRYGFGKGFIKLVNLIYANTTSKIKVNGKTSLAFILERGVRQGCPLSALLYTLIAEALACAIRSNKEITGITVNKTEKKVAQYADDTTLLLTKEKSFYALLKTLDLYEKATGAKIHPQKSQGMWLGSNRHRTEGLGNFEWRESLDALGLKFGNIQLQEDIWEKRVNSFKKTLQIWRSRHLSMKGKKIIVNQLAVAKLCYATFIFTCPAKTLQDIQSAIGNFFWSDKKTRIDRRIIYLPVRDGGLGLVNVQKKFQAMRLTWISQLFNPGKSGPWKTLMEYHLSHFRKYPIGKDIFKTYIDIGRLYLWRLTPFYQQLLKDWVTLTKNKRHALTGVDQYAHEPLFWNTLVAKRNTPEQPPQYHSPDRYITELKNQGTICRIGDLCYTVVPGFLTHAQTCELAGTDITLERIRKIKSFIPATWQNAIRNTPTTTVINTLNITYPTPKNPHGHKDIARCSSKDLYEFLNKDDIYTDKAIEGQPIYMNWIRKTGPVDWPRTFIGMYNDHTDKHVTDLQYKLLHHGIATRKRLHAGNSAKHTTNQDDPLCKKCRMEDENGEHIFIRCPTAKQTWGKAGNLIRSFWPEHQAIRYKHRYILAGYQDKTTPT